MGPGPQAEGPSLLPRPLAGVRVVELAHVMAGPTCARLLADLGADVIKVERPPHGDDARLMAPPWLGDAHDPAARESAGFVLLNHRKRSIAIDLKAPAGKEVLWALLGRADVLVENFRRGALDRLGFDWPAMHAANPRLVVCAISGFGRTGPYADRGGFDLIAQGMAGLMSVTGEGPGRPPVKPGVPVSDIAAGLHATIGVLAALASRAGTGLGQRVESSLFESAVALTTWHTAIHAATGASPGPVGSAHPLDAPYQAFEAADGHFTLGAANQANWLKLTAAIGRDDLARDPRFASNPDRMQHLPALVAALAAVFRTQPVAHWLALLEAAGVPAGPVNDIAMMRADPQLAARGQWFEVEHPVAGRTLAMGCPVGLPDAEPLAPPRPAPRLGEQGAEVLAELGFDAARIAALRAEGVVR
jgi:crotonobetainyl-CoA:carnitine CoA-transferase CaiB-like acyl-CoA transferase